MIEQCIETSPWPWVVIISVLIVCVAYTWWRKP